MRKEHFTVLSRKTVLDHPYIKVEYEEIRLPDGRIIPDWPIIHSKDFINAMVLNEKNEGMILKGYKHGPMRINWQVLGGYIEEGEEPLDCARRELMEETGYQSDNWTRLGTYVVDANRRTGTGHLFLARNARKVAPPNHDDLEYFEILWFPLEKIKEGLRNGKVAILSHAASISMGLNEL